MKTGPEAPFFFIYCILVSGLLILALFDDMDIHLRKWNRNTFLIKAQFHRLSEIKLYSPEI